MTSASSKTTRISVSDWLLHELDHMEAPDRAFIGHRDILIRNLARYHFVVPYVHGVALDIGCGRGYGFDVINMYSSAQIGIDLSRDFLRDAQIRYPFTPFAQAIGDQLPFADESFDSIIAFEVIEHIENDLAFLYEIKRLARPSACIAISTPNRLVASGNVVRPLNPFHVREYLADEFYLLLRQVFSSVEVFGQYEFSHNTSATNSLINRIPMGWKYKVPTHIQGIISVALRPPLRLEDCHFESGNPDRTHTLIALCHI